MKKIARTILACALAGIVAVSVLLSDSTQEASAAVYKENEYMKELQLPDESYYYEKDWKQTTIDFLTYMLDESNVYTDEDGTKKIARYTSSNNAKAYFESIGMSEEAPSEIWSIPPYVAKGDDATLGEGITVIAAVMSGALAGMDLTAYECSDGVTRNFVKGTVEYYQAANGENVVLNGGSGGRTGNTWWYELLPGVLFSVLGTQYESEAYYMYDIITESARQWRMAVEGLGGSNADFWHTSYKLSTGAAFDGNWYEPDAAAGMAYILYSAYSLNLNLKEQGQEAYATDEEIEEFREAAVWSMNYLDKLDQSPFYEVLTFLAPYLAARMNVEQGTNYDVSKMFSWVLDGTSAVRKGWGMVTENWGDKYTNGLMGSLTDGDGYAFAMNTFDAMLGFAPMVKYDTRFARDISRWVLCVSQSAQNYYPSEYTLEGVTEDAGNGNVIWHGKNQSGNWIDPDSDEAGFIAYEGLRHYRRYVVWENGTRTTKWDRTVSPYASGDAFTFDWGGKTDYGLYGSAHVGLFGSTISYTDVPMILRTDLSKLDVYSNSTIPFSMYYNPYSETKEITVTLSVAGNKLYDTVEKEYVKMTNVNGTTAKISIPADTTFVLAEIPEGAEVVKQGSDYLCNGEFVAQERGYVSLNVYSDEAGTQKVSANSTVEGTLYASLNMVVPESASVESLTLTYAGATLYTGTTSPQGLIPIDTTLLKNGKGSMTATLTLSGNKQEKSSIALQVLNVVKTPAVEYDDVNDMVSSWNAETENWQTLYPNSDHTSVASVGSGGKFTVSVASPKGYGFVTSEMFTIDFSREPMLEMEVSEVSSSYAIKIYVENMTAANNYTGVYLLRDTQETGMLTINILEAILEEDRTFDMTGAHKASIKICPVGGEGDYVAIDSFNVYHMYTTPVLEEPDEYQWGHYFTSEWLSLWSGAASDGGVNGASLQYTNDGTVVVSASDSANGYSGVASPVIVTDLGQNPVFDLKVVGVTGKYFLGVKFEGNDKLYIIADNKTDLTSTVEIVSALKANYSDETFKGIANMQLILGVRGEGVAEFDEVYTYYKLPAWGTTVRNETWLDWEILTNATATATLELDTSNRAVITNNGSSESDTATAGVRGKFTLNFDYNPEMSIQVRGAMGQYRFALTLFNSEEKYYLTDWSSARTTVELNLKEALNGKLNGKQNVYFSIEILGGGKTVTIGRIETYYTSIQPDFASGKTLTEEIATWTKDETNPSNVAVDGGKVTISENYADSRGLYTDELTVSANDNPYIEVNISSISDDAVWYLNAIIDGVSYPLTGKESSTSTGLTAIDVVAALKKAGYVPSRDIVAVYELGGNGVSFEVTVSYVRFVCRLMAPEGLIHDFDENVIGWTAVSGATGYSIRVENANGDIVLNEKNWTATSYNLASADLEKGVYRIYISAYGTSVLESAESRLAFKQGDIESVTLAKPSDIVNNGMLIEWSSVANAEAYEIQLVNADTNETIHTTTVTEACFDLSTLGLTAFNYKISIVAKGDGVVYLDGETAEYAFYTNVIENYNAKKFQTMSSNDNQASATYDQATDVSTLTVPYTNWGSIVSLSTTLNFDNSPVLAIRFAPGCEGGYYLKIMIDGVGYYLADNTFTIHGNASPIDVFVDIRETLATRKDGPGKVSGTHTVNIVFGATADGFDGATTPVVKFAYAQLIEMTPGSGVAKLGTLSEPAVSVADRVAAWTAVENASQYIVVISNESGVLLSVTVDGTSYDLSMLKRAGEYTVQVTAVADDYYSSDTGSASFTISEDIVDQPDGDSDEDSEDRGCSGSVSLLGVGVLLAAVCPLLIKRRRKI